MTVDEQPSRAGVGRPRRAASVGLQVVAVVGFAVAVLLAVLVLLGRGWAVERVEAIGTSVDAALQRGLPLLDAADQRVSEVAAEAQQLRDAAAALASAEVPAPNAAATLSERLSAISERYVPLRAAYADARADLVSAVDRLETVARFVPGAAVPRGPVESLAALDESVRAMDDRVMSLLAASRAATVVQDTAERVSTAAGDVQASLDAVSARLADAEARLQEARGEIASTVDSVTTLLTIGAIVVVLLLLYVAALHVVLLRAAGGLRRPASS